MRQVTLRMGSELCSKKREIGEDQKCQKMDLPVNGGRFAAAIFRAATLLRNAGIGTRSAEGFGTI